MNAHRTIANEAIQKATDSEMTVYLPYHFEVECALMARCDSASVHTGIDGQDYRIFRTFDWRVVLIGK